ncbi:DUF389 domain-containing protein [Sphingomicrobium clamense]|uniref:DUF389 domain-containing protein n=1 Tax=Sphingomicrobium clamense TaxID=2851013 RepID=A0ABS6V3X1_9SPHN|nr:DUF389 domain-containing protein [Sphingomicrobium sp. B8]MBW0144252.1 DUF389 domain-containing protein [Sphingomicrobium sp. B8]
MNDTVTLDEDAESARKAEEQRIRQRERLRILASLRQWWRRNFVKTVDQYEAIRRVKDEGGLDGRYLFMISMSAGIACLGLILSSPAVVIGAMLLSPLMGPIIGAGFALASWDVRWLRDSSKCLFVGVVTAIFIAAVITWMSPIQTITSEIAARTRPNLLDLGVAFFSGLAGAFAMIRGRQGTIVGVAIAVALMPPLAVVGFGLATLNWAVFGGALMLFITNLITIAATSAAMARLYGFSTQLSKQHTLLQSVVILFALFLLSIPLYLTLSQIRDEAFTQRLATQSLNKEFGDRARVETPVIDFDSEPVQVSATIFTPEFREEAEARIEEQLSAQLNKPVVVTLDQFRVPVDAGAAEEAELAAARSRAQAEATQRAIDDLTDRLALIAGVDKEAITIDRVARTARVRARPIEGATLSAYRDLERRVAQRTPGWSLALVPPARPLPTIAVNEDGTPDASSVALAAWAQQRVEAPITLTGDTDAVAIVANALRDAGATGIVRREGTGDTVELAWAAPDATEN